MIDLSAGTISMVGVLGPLCNTFTGRCRFEADPATGGYKMVYGWVGVGGSVCVGVAGRFRKAWVGVGCARGAVGLPDEKILVARGLGQQGMPGAWGLGLGWGVELGRGEGGAVQLLAGSAAFQCWCQVCCCASGGRS